MKRSSSDNALIFHSMSKRQYANQILLDKRPLTFLDMDSLFGKT